MLGRLMNVDSGYSFRVKAFLLKMCYEKCLKKSTTLSTSVSYNNSSTQRINMIFLLATAYTIETRYYEYQPQVNSSYKH